MKILQAHKMSPCEPLACNELGVLASRKGQHANATHWFLRALDLVPGKLTAGKLAVVIPASPVSRGCVGVGGEISYWACSSKPGKLKVGHLLTLLMPHVYNNQLLASSAWSIISVQPTSPWSSIAMCVLMLSQADAVLFVVHGRSKSLNCHVCSLGAHADQFGAHVSQAVAVEQCHCHIRAGTWPEAWAGRHLCRTGLHPPPYGAYGAAKLNSIEPQTRSELSQEGRPELGVITCVRVVLHSLTKLLAELIRPTTALVLDSLS